MPTMADAVDWQAIPADVAAVAGYIDGPVSAWPAEAWARFAGRRVLRVSVLADPTAMSFDSEPGNAGVTAVAVAVRLRANRGEPSVVYTDESNSGGLTAALAAKSLRWLPAGSWPAPGPYLWAAAPGTVPGTIPSWCPVQPVAVQDRWEHTYDLSTLFAGWLPPTEPASVPAPDSTGTPAPAPAQTYALAPDDAIRTGAPRRFVPIPTYDEAAQLLAQGVKVYVWTTVDNAPVLVSTLGDLHTIEHTGDHAYPQYVTYVEAD